MTTVYFIRHGTTDNNVKGVFQGSTNAVLGERGLAQAAALGERFASVPLAAVYSSPLERAMQTARGVCAQLPIEPIPVDGLREIDGGVLEGRTNEVNTSEYPAIMHALRNDPTRFNPPEGEPARQVHERVTAAVRELVAQNPDREIAVVSHGFALLCYLGCLDTPFEEMEFDIVSNCSVTCVDYFPDGTHRLRYRNDVSHIPPELQFRSKFWEKPKGSETK